MGWLLRPIPFVVPELHALDQKPAGLDRALGGPVSRLGGDGYGLHLLSLEPLDGAEDELLTKALTLRLLANSDQADSSGRRWFLQMTGDVTCRLSTQLGNQHAVGVTLTTAPNPGLIQRVAQMGGEVAVEVESGIPIAVSRDVLQNTKVIRLRRAP